MPLLLASRRSGAHRQPGSYNHVLCCTRDRDPASSTWGEQELKKNHRNNARGREVQAGWEGRVTSHTQTPRLCWGWQGPTDPAWNSPPSGAFGASSTWRAERQPSAIPSLPELLHPPSWHSRDIRPPLGPGAALAPWGGGRGGRAHSSRGLAPGQGRAEEAGGRPRAGVRRHSQSIPGGTALLFPRGDHARSRQQEIQTTLIF